jgi:hypothetical protein
MQSGLAAIGAGHLMPDSSTRFFWYADILDKSQECRFATGDGAGYRAKGLEFMEDMRDVILKLAGLPNDASRALVAWRLSDTEKYLRNGGIACKVDLGLDDVFREASESASALVVVAHSMGSLIVYKNLMNALKGVPVPVYLLTIGSMLGERTVQRTLLGSLSEFPAPVPLPVFWWRNVLNRGDLLAFRSHDAFSSTYPAKVPKDIEINTSKTDRHDAAEYLQARATAEALREAWCAGLEQGQRQAGCR